MRTTIARLLPVAAAVTLLAAPAYQPAARPLDAAVATVDGQPITLGTVRSVRLRVRPRRSVFAQ